MKNLVGGFTCDNSYGRNGGPVQASPSNLPASERAPRPSLALPLPRKLPLSFGALRAALGLQPPSLEMLLVDAPTSIATFCAYTLGILRKEEDVPYALHRAVPSPRCLCASRLYLWVPPGLDLPTGVYRYDPLRHALEVLPISEGVGAAWTGSHLMFFITVNFNVLADIYGEFSLRLGVLEAGHVVENLALLGRALGYAVSWRGFYDDQLLLEALGLTGVSDGLLAVVEMHHTTGLTYASSPRPAQAILPDTWHPQLGRLPRMQALAARVSRPVCIGSRARDELPAGRRIALPATPDAGAADLRRLLLERNSGGEYLGLIAKAQPISLDAFSAVLSSLDAPDLASDLEGVIPELDIMIAATHVAGVPMGLYRYLPQTRELLEVPGAPTTAERLAQQLLGNGVAPDSLAFRLFLVAPCALAFQQAAERAYRLLHLRAGALCQRISLAAAEQELFCRPFLNIDFVECERSLGLSNSDHIILYHMLIGRNGYRGWVHDMSL